MKTKTIEISEITTGTLSNSDGIIVYNSIKIALEENEFVILSFENISTISSSFLNSSIGAIIENYSLDILKNRIKISHYTKYLAKVIQKYIKDVKESELK